MNLWDLWRRARTLGIPAGEETGFAKSSLRVKAAFRSDAGGRANNEDQCAVRIPGEGDPWFSRGWLAIVADGMGGHNAGSVASKLTVDCVVREYYESPDTPARSLRSAVFSANRGIRKEARRNKLQAGMGATCTVLVGVGDRAYLAHVGDSRLYLLRDGLILRLTEDHSVSGGLVRRGLPSPDRAAGVGERSIVLRALGVDPDVVVAEWDAPLPLLPGDRFILCTDGLSNALEDEDIRGAGGDPDCDAACQSLMAFASEKGAADNVTMVIVDITAPPAADSPADSQVSEVAS